MTRAQTDLDPGPDIDRTDLSSAFGDSAADALRGLLAPRRVPVQAVDDPDDGPEPDTRTTEEPSEPHARRRTDAAATPVARPARPARPAPGRATPSRATPSHAARDGSEPSRGTRDSSKPPRATPSREEPGRAAPAHRRRLQPVRVRAREDVDLLLLAVARDGVANGREFIARVRERSGGAVELTERCVYHELHRLRNNRLIADTGRGGRTRFVLTDSGERILVARTHRWQAYARAMGQVLGE